MSIEMRVQANSQPKLLELHTIQAGSFISTTQSLLNKYREPLRKNDYEKMQIEYESFYHTCNGVTLMGFDKIADFALRLDDLKPIDWTKSTRLATLWDAWQNDSLLLGRSKSITTLVGYCQLAYLVANKQSLNSTSKVIEALGVRQKKIAPLARFDFVPFDEELKQLIVRINTILGKEVFPKDFEPIWESERKIQNPVVRHSIRTQYSKAQKKMSYQALRSST